MFFVVVMILTTSSVYAQTNFEVIDGLNYFLNHSENTASLSGGHEKTSGDVVVPEKVTAKDGKEYRVISFGSQSFYKCSGFTSITIPSSVTSLGWSCFSGCTGLTSLTIPSSVTSWGNSCFSGCTGLTSFIIPSSITSLKSSCFARCSGLTSVTIPSSVTSFGEFCFYGCTSLTDIAIPSSVTSFGEGCFSGSGLTNIEIPSSVTSLGKECFYHCSSLNFVTIPASVTSLDDGCFYSCDRLANIEIPSSVTSLGEKCFYDCRRLAYIEIPSSVISLGDNCFDRSHLQTMYFWGKLPANISGSGIPTTCKIYVLKEYLQDYQDALGIKYHVYGIDNPTNINQVKKSGIVAKSDGGIVTLSGLDNGEVVKFFSPDGRQLGAAKAENGIASCAVTSSIVVVKVGAQSIKLVVK